MSRWSLVVMRHADAEPARSDQADVDRPLTQDGRRRAAARRDAVVRADPDLILCSAAVRARQTLAALGDLRAAVLVEEGLYAASATSVLLRLAEVEEEVGTAMLIGHLPTVDQLVRALLRGDQPAVRFRPAALAQLQLPDPWARLAPASATLRHVIP